MAAVVVDTTVAAAVVDSMAAAVVAASTVEAAVMVVADTGKRPPSVACKSGCGFHSPQPLLIFDDLTDHSVMLSSFLGQPAFG
jgi:hypothetical protein